MKTNYRLPVILCGMAISAALAQHSFAQSILFSDNFDADTSANWTVLEGSVDGVPDYRVLFAFDYSTNKFNRNGVVGTIPPAPNGGGKGVKMWVNKNDTTAAQSAVSIFPTGRTFSGNYALKVDMWLNYNGGSFGGSGSTEFGTFGINHSGQSAVWDNAGTIGDGTWFAVTGEGGAAGDYRAYAGTRWPGQSGGFLDRNNDFLFEDEVITGEEPLNWIFYSPISETPGMPGKQWVEVEVRQRTNELGGNVITWLMNGYVIAQHSLGDGIFATSGNVMLGNMDIFASIADPAADNFVIFDNARVVDLSTAPEQPIITLEATDGSAAEAGGDTGLFTVSRTGSTAADLVVKYRVAGSATSGADYTALPGSVTIPAGQSTATIPLTPLNDQVGESTEVVNLFLTGSTSYDLYTNFFAAVEIKDDGDVPFVTVTAAKTNAYERNPDNDARFSILLSSPNSTPTTVNFTTGGTAVAGTDYTPVGTSIVVPANETNAIVRVRPINNSAANPDPRTVTLTLASGTGYLLGATTNGSVSIRDDDFLTLGDVLYSETFETDAVSRWVVNAPATGDYPVDLWFDYSTVGISPAPNTSGNSTRGAKLQANLISGVFGGVSISPTTLNLTGDYALRFDLWQNFNGPFPGGGNGSTQITGAGVGTAGTTPQWPAGTQDSVWFAITGDGGSGVDYRAYSSAAATGYTEASGVFAAGNVAGVRNNTYAYYAEFGGEAAPAAQVALFPDQTGRTAQGVPGLLWRDVVIEKVGNRVRWFMDGKLLATVNADATNFAGGNILLNHSDINATSSSDPNAPATAFGLFDNVRVYRVATVKAPPSIDTIQMINAGAQVQIEFTGTTDDTTASFALQASSTVGSGYGDATATISSLGNGRFRAVASAGAGPQFFRIRRQ